MDVTIVILVELCNLVNEDLILLLEALAYFNQLVALLLPYLGDADLRAAFDELDLSPHLLQFKHGITLQSRLLLYPLPVRVLLLLLLLKLAGYVRLREFLV